MCDSFLTSSSIVTGYFPDRNPTSGSWRAVKLKDDILEEPSPAGWGEVIYCVVVASNSSKDASSSPVVTEQPVNTTYESTMTVGACGGSCMVLLDSQLTDTNCIPSFLCVKNV